MYSIYYIVAYIVTLYAVDSLPLLSHNVFLGALRR